MKRPKAFEKGHKLPKNKGNVHIKLNIISLKLSLDRWTIKITSWHKIKLTIVTTISLNKNNENS